MVFEVVGHEAEPDFSVPRLASGTTCFPGVPGRREVVVKREDLGVRQLWV